MNTWPFWRWVFTRLSIERDRGSSSTISLDDDSVSSMHSWLIEQTGYASSMKSNTSIASKPGSSFVSSTTQWLRQSFLGTLSGLWKSASGMIRRYVFRKPTHSPTRPYEFLRQMRSQSSSSTPRDEGVSLGFSRQEIAAAKVVVKRLVGSQMRKGPTDLLLLPRHHVEQWFNDEAVRYLQEQKAKRSQPVAVIH